MAAKKRYTSNIRECTLHDPGVHVTFYFASGLPEPSTKVCEVVSGKVCGEVGDDATDNTCRLIRLSVLLYTHVT